MKFSGKVGNGPMNNKWLNFGGDPHHRLDTGIVFLIRHYWEIRKMVNGRSLWSPYVTGQTIIFLPCDFYLLSSSFFLFFPSPNLSGRRLDVYHTSTHGVALARI